MSDLQTRAPLPVEGGKWLALVVGFTIGLGAPAAWAQDDSAAAPPAAQAPSISDTEVWEANRSFELGRVALARGRSGEACRRFDESRGHFPSPVTLLNLGDCYERGDLGGGLLAALQAFEQARLEGDKVTPEATRKLVTEEAQRRAHEVRARLAHLTLLASATEGASVRLNGALLERLDAALPLNPGRYQLEVSAPGKKPHLQQFDLSEGLALQIALPALVGDPPVPPAAPQEPSATTRRQSTPRFGNVPFWLGGAAAVIGGAWLYTGLTSSAKDGQYGKLWARCAAAPCDESTLDKARVAHRTAKSYALATDYALIPAFGATLGTAIVLWWLDDFALGGAAETGHRSTGSTQAGCSASGCWLEYESRF